MRMMDKQYKKTALRVFMAMILMLGSLSVHAYTKSNVSITVNGVQRNMILFTPDGVTSGLPLMIVTHGMGQDPTYQYEGDRLYQLIDTERFIIAYLASNGSTWDTGGNGDLDFVDAAINHLDNLYHIDRNRLYWSGFSMGSMLIYHAIQTEMGKKFAAFAPCSGILFYNQPWYDRSIPINLIHCHAYGDEVFPYNSCEGKYDYSIRDYVSKFATILNQNTNYTKTTGVKPNAADFGWVDGDKEVWSGGSKGGEVELFSANSGGHWPTGAYMYEIWNFCKRFSLQGTNAQGEANVSASYEVGDDIVNAAPTSWAGQTGVYGEAQGFDPLGHRAYERYQNGSLGKGDVMTQTLTGVKNGTYDVTLELAASYTSGRGFECPTGTGHSLAFVNDQFRPLEVVDREWVSSIEPLTVSCTVTNGTLRYGIYNIEASGNWYVANVTSIEYVSANTDNTFNINTAAQHGTITASTNKTAAGTTVTLSATPAANYQFESFTVTTCTGENVTVNGNTFVMPAADVTATANFSFYCNVGDDIVAIAPTTWEGQTGTYAGLGYTVSERYKHGGDNGTGDVLTQTLTGLKNGVYAVILELAASFTSGRGFDCPTGDGLSVAFANGSQTNLEVVDRQGVGSVTPITLYATVTDGTLKYGIQNLQVSGNWYIANVTGIKYISESTSLTHQLSVTSAGVATLYLPFDAAVPDADFFIVAAVKSVSGTTAQLKEVRGVIPAQTGVMIFANAGNYTLSLAPTPSTESVESLLHGVLEETPVTTLAEQEGKTIYVLSRGVQEYTGFKPVYGTGSVKTIPAYKAYLPLEGSGEVNFINLSFGGDATAIEKILRPTDDGQWTMDDGQWYTLDGRRLNAKPTQRGLYIVNGKKVLVK